MEPQNEALKDKKAEVAFRTPLGFATSGGTPTEQKDLSADTPIKLSVVDSEASATLAGSL